MGADLIVLGPHAWKVGKKKDLIGDTYREHRGRCDHEYHDSPVMIVNRLMPKERLNFKKIMICIDFSKSCAYGFQFASTLARRYGSKLFLFISLTTPERETPLSLSGETQGIL